MKKLTKKVLYGLCLCYLMAFISIKKSKQVEVVELKSQPIVKIKPPLQIELKEINFKGHTAFLEAIGQKESSNRYWVVNKFGYMGKYQFGRKTLQSLDINVSRKTFLSSPDLQEEAMDRLLTQNYKSLKRYIDKYEGKNVHGVFITKSGVLAAAHLAGAGNVRRFFRRGYEFTDGNGTKMTSYMRLFSGYDLNI